MGLLEAFKDEHWLHPWADFDCYWDVAGRPILFCSESTEAYLSDGYGAPAGDMYAQAYKPFLAAQGVRGDGPQAFAEALQGDPRLGYWRDEGSRHYRGLTILSRRERAELAERSRLFWAEVRDRVYAESAERHRVAAHADGSACEHERKREVAMALDATAREEVATMALDADQASRLAAGIEADFGAYLRWRPGDPEPSAPPGAHHHGLTKVERGEVSDHGAEDAEGGSAGVW